MSRRLVYGLSILFAILAATWFRTSADSAPENAAPIPGRNNTVLFITSEPSGLSNVHLATTYALLENHPNVEVHYASFTKLEKRLRQTSDAAVKKNPNARPVTWHGVSGTNLETSFYRTLGSANGMIEDTGVRGMAKKVHDLRVLLTSFTAEEHWETYQRLVQIIEEVDPALVVIDHVLKPATDLTENVNRRFITISPNALVDLIVDRQPWGAMFWKYPATASGYPFPVPWHLIPANIYIELRIIFGILTAPGIGAVRTFLENKGIKNPAAFGLYPKRTPLLAMTLPEANIPLDFIPPEISLYGPIVLETSPIEDQDGPLARWLKENKGSKTILVNLGSLYEYSEDRGKTMAAALAKVLAEVKDARIIWRFRKEGEWDEKPALAPLKGFIKNGRAQVLPWLEIDPTSLLMTGYVDLVVHHGGGNSYHEAVYAGVPQVTLPLWFDCYNIAGTAVYQGVGYWPGRDTAPSWDVDTIGEGIIHALVGEGSVSMREKAKALSVKARAYGGRNAAAAEVARLAGQGI